jgi:succinyl-CoA synthetase alpha subunit
LEIGILKAVIFGGLTMMSKEEIEAEANEWIRSQGWSEETLPSDEYNQMVAAYVAGYSKKCEETFEMALSQIKHDREVVVEENQRLMKKNAELKERLRAVVEGYVKD